MSTGSLRGSNSTRVWAIAASLGAVIGASMRYGVGLAVPHESFPIATLMVNVVGALAIGIISQTSAIMESPVLRHFVVTGVLGGFTTFSAIAVETLSLSNVQALAYLSLTILGGLGATALGVKFAKPGNQ
jgi:CrcB protein